MAYNSQSGIFTAPVTMPDDFRQVFGNESEDLRSLCTSGKINIWAKYKPVALASKDTSGQWDAARNEWKDSADWFHGNTGCFGLIPWYTNNNFRPLLSAYDGGMNGWTYDRPRGGDSSPYRLTDFACYNHNAVPMITKFSIKEKIAVTQTFTATCIMAVEGAYNAAVADMGLTLYFGVAIVNSSNIVVYHGTSSEPGNAGVSFDLPAVIDRGEYTVYPFFSSTAIAPTVGEPSGSRRYYTCPNVSTATLTVTTKENTIDVTCSAKYNKARTQVNVTVKNDDVSTFENCQMQLRFSRNSANDTMEQGEQYHNFTLTAGTTYTHSFTGIDRNTTYHVIVRIKGDNYTYDVGIMSSDILLDE